MIQQANFISKRASVSSRFWTPADGRVFSTDYALDTETTLIDKYRPELVPQLVIAGASDGQLVYFLKTDTIGDFLRLHRDLKVVMHNAPFDLAVIQQAVGDQFDVYELVEDNRVRDTLLLHRLVRLAADGTAEWDGSSLEDAADYWLDIQLDKHGIDGTGRQIRTNFGQYLTAPMAIPELYLNYLVDDVVTTFQLYEALNLHLKILWQDILSTQPFGFVGEKHLHGMWCKHGPLTHHIQLKAAIVLDAITRNGLHVDTSQLAAYQQELQDELSEVLETLRADYGFRPGKGSLSVLQQILLCEERNNDEVQFPRTRTGKISTAADNLELYKATIPFVDRYLRYGTIEKLLGTFLNKMQKGVLHPTFDVLKNTGRTSAFGDISSQNLPRNERIRNLFVPSSGNVFIDADYSAVEMVTLGQAALSQFGGQSKMAETINGGTDLHRLVASRLTGKPESEISDDERQKAKAVNFGLPGGMGTKTLRQYAQNNYRVDMTESEAERWTDTWFNLFSEMRRFLDNGNNLGEDIARLLNITFTDYCRATSQDTGFWADKIGVLGWMARKAFLEESPSTGNGRAYTEAECDYFWQQLDNADGDALAALLKEFIGKCENDIKQGKTLCRKLAAKLA